MAKSPSAPRSEFTLDDLPWLKPHTDSARRRRNLLFLYFAGLVVLGFVAVLFIEFYDSDWLVAAAYLGVVAFYLAVVYGVSELFSGTLRTKGTGRVLALGLLVASGVFSVAFLFVGVMRDNVKGGMFLAAVQVFCPTLILAVLAAWLRKRRRAWRMRFAHVSMLSAVTLCVGVGSIFTLALLPEESGGRRTVSKELVTGVLTTAIYFGITALAIVVDVLLLLGSFVFPRLLDDEDDEDEESGSSRGRRRASVDLGLGDFFENAGHSSVNAQNKRVSNGDEIIPQNINLTNRRPDR